MESTDDVETLLSETGIMMPSILLNIDNPTHSNNELVAGQSNKENEPGNFDRNSDAEMVDAEGTRKRKNTTARSRMRSRAPRNRRVEGIASRTRSRSKRGHSNSKKRSMSPEQHHIEYVCSICGAKDSKKSMRGKRAK